MKVYGGFHLGVKWTSKSAFKLYLKVVWIVKPSFLSDCEELGFWL